VAELEEMSTPSIRKNLMQRQKLRQQEGSSGSISYTQQSQDSRRHRTPLVKARKHQQYLKYGDVPVLLMKSGSMRAGPSLKKKSSPQRVVQGSRKVVWFGRSLGYEIDS
jgi:hypothetical protein